ncbi:ATP-binding protein [Streptomyces sp. H27-D2]|uniref:ATP-binding protein n=1 Tax=Streptomyces sp. H27-D2 TaxID=3046304 RepID=UPI002DBE0C52|nr:ATP-binding protein [Streptomyces sp. H27-D2]MEC4018483.1 ATP-binding protein [Streptomyces sp. H27-D2]
MPEEPWTYGLYIPRDPRAVGVVRATLRSILAAARLDCLIDTTELLVSELVTNAYRHSGCEDAFVSVDWVPDDLRVAIWDTGPALPRKLDPGPEDENGRGLGLVEALAETWGVEEFTDKAGEVTGKSVWFSMAPKPA